MSDPLYIVRGYDNDLWGYDTVCAGSLAKCKQFVANTPYFFESSVTFDRIEIAKRSYWTILEETEMGVFRVGVLVDISLKIRNIHLFQMSSAAN